MKDLWPVEKTMVLTLVCSKAIVLEAIAPIVRVKVLKNQIFNRKIWIIKQTNILSKLQSLTIMRLKSKLKLKIRELNKFGLYRNPNLKMNKRKSKSKKISIYKLNVS